MTGSEGDPLDAAIALDELATDIVRHLSDRQSMSMTAASTLARLEREGPVRLTALAAAEGITQPSMTQLVQRLERQGLVGRVNDPEDGRVTLVGVTDSGRELIAERRRTRRARLAELLAALPAEEEQAVTAALRTALPVVRRLIRDAADRTRPHSGAPAS